MLRVFMLQVIWRIYDQSPKMNHLDIAPPGGAHRAEDSPVNATREKLMVGGKIETVNYYLPLNP